MEKFFVIYCSENSYFSIGEFSNMSEVSALLEGISDIHGNILFGDDFERGEVMIIKGKEYIPKAVSKINLWE